MSIELLENTKFLDKVKVFYQKNKKHVDDVVLFGSTVRGKYNPKDIDILLIFKKKDDTQITYELKKTLKEYDVQLISKTYKSLLSDMFKAKVAYLSEGYSLIKNKTIAQIYGYTSIILFKYELNNLNKSKRVMFYYSLYGRGSNKGILDKYDLIKFSDTVILSPIDKSESVKEYLDQWNIKYSEVPTLIPKRIVDIF